MKNLIIIIGTILLGVIIVNTMVLGDEGFPERRCGRNSRKGNELHNLFLGFWQYDRRLTHEKPHSHNRNGDAGRSYIQHDGRQQRR